MKVDHMLMSGLNTDLHSRSNSTELFSIVHAFARQTIALRQVIVVFRFRQHQLLFF